LEFEPDEEIGQKGVLYKGLDQWTQLSHPINQAAVDLRPLKNNHFLPGTRKAIRKRRFLVYSFWLK